MKNKHLEAMPTEMVAELLDVTDRAVRKWAVDEGMPHFYEGKDLRFHWRACLEWWAANKCRASVALRGTGVATRAESEARILEIRAQREAMRLEKDQGQLLPLDAIIPAWLQVAETTKNRVLTIKSRVAEALPHLTSDDLKVIDAQCWDALDELSQCPTASSN